MRAQRRLSPPPHATMNRVVWGVCVCVWERMLPPALGDGAPAAALATAGGLGPLVAGGHERVRVFLLGNAYTYG